MQKTMIKQLLVTEEGLVKMKQELKRLQEENKQLALQAFRSGSG